MTNTFLGISIGGREVCDLMSDPPKYYNVVVGTMIYLSEVLQKLKFVIQIPKASEEFQGEFQIGSSNGAKEISVEIVDSDTCVVNRILEICMSEEALKQQLLPFLTEIPAEEMEAKVERSHGRISA